MKLEKRLFISGEEVKLVSNIVSLKLSLGSVAIFEIEAKGQPELFESVRFDIGYESKTAPWFEGYIDKVQPAENGYHKITVKELVGILSKRWALSLEHPTAEQVIDALAELTGLEFNLPEVDYIKTTIPNFVCQGTGYQCLEQVAKAFSICDCVWFQDIDQVVYFGSYQDCHFYKKPMPMPKEFTSRQSGNSVTFVPFPMLRPGRIMNDKRVNRLDLIQDEMTAYWKTEQSEVSPKKRETLQNFPELAAGFHLPKFGRVEAVRDMATAGQVADPFRPRFAVDVQVLDEDLTPDRNVPVYRSIPIPVHMSGHESGLLAYPLEGTLVEIAFAYGRNDRPIIRGVYGRDYALPSIEPGEQLQQQREEVSTRIDAAGNTSQQTDQTQKQRAFEKIDQVERYRGEFGQHHLIVDEHSVEEVIGKKLIEALGAINLLAGDDIVLGSLGNIQTATAGELVEAIGKVRRSIAAEHQWLQSPKTWVGSKQENVLILLSELMQVVKELADTLATHTHKGVAAGPATTKAPVQASVIRGHGTESIELKGRLDPITQTS
ncbi:Phage protein [Vibrio crassostreae]|nr:Phage protein [Vibrio crassostreae]CAK2718590.1 Phage protein [Vibrio crassostreae]CAK3879041.1 Phage protein [Vibrio crassostreae]